MKFRFIIPVCLAALPMQAWGQEQPPIPTTNPDFDAELTRAQVKMLEDQIIYLGIYIKKSNIEKKAMADWWAAYVGLTPK